MLFNSLEFLVFLPLVMLGFHYLKNHRIMLLLIASYIFYGWWNWLYLPLILLSTVVDYLCAIGMQESKRPKKLFLIISIATNLSILGFFKYYNFFIGEANEMLAYLDISYAAPITNFLLPMGISFYTFQSMAYTVDVYRGQTQVEKNFPLFGLYVSFFPQLVAGPIERAGHLINQLREVPNFKSENIREGFYRIIFGLFKKVVIADRLAPFVDQVYSNPEHYDGSMLTLATLFFAFQIYCDFSGYSDIAIGTARMFGINLMENFKNPYLAKNIREFWSRWHISLSTWFRDYLYIPLGGNRSKWARNIFITFFISGLWHGANWTFIVWGALHGIYLLITIYLIKQLPDKKNRFLNYSGVLLTFIFTTFSWIFFRANSIQDALAIIRTIPEVNVDFVKDMVFQMKTGILVPSTLTKSFMLNFGEYYFKTTVGDLILSMVLIPALVWVEWFKLNKKMSHNPKLRFGFYAAGALLIIFFGVFTKNQFIYFQF